MNDQLPTLQLGLTSWGTVLAETSARFVGGLRSVQLAYPSAEVVGRSAFELDLGTFLGNLAALRRWPYPTVVWTDQLRSLAERSLDDSDYLDQHRSRVGSDASASSDIDIDIEESLGTTWQGNLTDFQKRDLRKLINMRHGANFSVPGAGKTRVALAVFAYLRELGSVSRAIVIAPKSAHESWQVETSIAFSIPPSVAIVSGNAIPAEDIVLLNYEKLPGVQRGLAATMRETPTLLILDEAHRMKRGSAGTYGSICLALGPLATVRLILSGTPAPNGMNDLRSLMEFSWPGRGSRLLGVGGTNSERASSAVSALFTRTTKRELKLPPLKISTKTLELPPVHREIYDALLGQLRTSIPTNERLDDLGRIIVYLLMAATSPALLALGASRYDPLQFRVPPIEAAPKGVLRSLLGDLPSYEMSPKILEGVRIARRNAAEGKKTLIWSTFIRNLTTIESLIPELGPQVVVGSSTDDERRAMISRFRSSPDAYVLLSNPSTLGEGVSLHLECHDAVYVDRDFAAGRFLQSIDRIHRLGLPPSQETRVTVLMAGGTIDELVHARLASKLRWMRTVLDDRGLQVLADLEEERESADVLDASDAAAVWAYLGISPAK